MKSTFPYNYCMLQLERIIFIYINSLVQCCSTIIKIDERSNQLLLSKHCVEHRFAPSNDPRECHKVTNTDCPCFSSFMFPLSTKLYYC